MRLFALIRNFGAAACLCALSLSAACAAGGEAGKIEQVDVAPCLAATAADDVEKAAFVCAEAIDNEKTARADRIKALIARAALLARHDQIDRAIADYSLALQLDPSAADVFNARGELWVKKGDRPNAVKDFGAALRLDPNNESARANHKAMARELERLGAQMAVAGKPSFDCARTRRAVEKAICANPELADLDREIFAANARVVREARTRQAPREARRSGTRDAQALQREQDDFVARRNAEFGRSGYDLKKAMQERLQRLNGVDGY
jgi:tetratricopeptide (TPR) repeat protein